MMTTKLSLVAVGDEPPDAFRIFSSGNVETTKGTFTFDAKAAALVLAEWKRHGSELMIDYDHASLLVGADPAQSGKAAGWFNLEVRADGLYAVNVRWTPLAADALRRKEWRYMSPAFTTDESGRVTSLINVALTNLPAIRRLEPLMAASLVGRAKGRAVIGASIEFIACGDRGSPQAIEAAGRRLGLSPREVEMCKRLKIDPAKYAANRAGIRAKSQR